MGTPAAAERLRQACGTGATPRIEFGEAGLVAVATHPDVDIVICASSGTTALGAVLAAIDAGKTIALANKEVLVMAGELVMAAARSARRRHSARRQRAQRDSPVPARPSPRGGPTADPDRFGWTVPRLDATKHWSGWIPALALQHPTWQMGRKITVDSATLMNKGLEVIEARWLFDVDADRIDVLVHPQSIVHSMVEFCDGSVIAQLGVTDMRLPIQYACSYPERWEARAAVARSGAGRPAGVLRARSRAVSLPRPGVSGAAHRRDAALRAQRRQRGGRRGVSRGTSAIYRTLHVSSQARWTAHDAMHVCDTGDVREADRLGARARPSCGRRVE